MEIWQDVKGVIEFKAPSRCYCGKIVFGRWFCSKKCYQAYLKKANKYTAVMLEDMRKDGFKPYLD
jgi:hypothetical protein